MGSAPARFPEQRGGADVELRVASPWPGAPLASAWLPPFEFHSAADLVVGAFERQGQGPLLRLELISTYPEPTVVIAPRVLIGQRVGGVATDFVQGY